MPDPAQPTTPKNAPFSVRIAPRTRYALTKAAMAERRSAARHLQWLIERGAAEAQVWRPNGERVALNVAINEVWDDDPALRLARLACAFPSLLSPKEGGLWRQICSDMECWREISRGICGDAAPRWRKGPSNLDVAAVHRLYGEQL